MDSDHPLMKNALKKIQDYAESADSIIEDIESAYTTAVFTFDFELLDEAKGFAKEALDRLNAYLKDQDEKYDQLVKTLNIFGKYDDSDIIVMLWDFKRPIMYRVQRLNKLIASIDEVFT